jgi:sugar-specific transcriptional regulator TrmB
VNAQRIALLAVGALLAAGCGGSSRLSRSEFVQRANAVCTKYEQKVTRAMAGINPGDQTQLAGAIDKALPVIREGNDELRALKPPEDLQQRFDRWLRIADDEVAAATQLRDGLKKDDTKAVRSAFQKLRVSDAAQDTVARKELGLTRCASSSSD